MRLKHYFPRDKSTSEYFCLGYPYCLREAVDIGSSHNWTPSFHSISSAFSVRRACEGSPPTTLTQDWVTRPQLHSCTSLQGRLRNTVKFIEQKDQTSTDLAEQLVVQS